MSPCRFGMTARVEPTSCFPARRNIAACRSITALASPCSFSLYWRAPLRLRTSGRQPEESSYVRRYCAAGKLTLVQDGARTVIGPVG